MPNLQNDSIKNHSKAKPHTDKARTTNRRHSKITPKDESVKILSSNIDTLVLSLDILWDEIPLFFSDLIESKTKAQSESKDCPLSFEMEGQGTEYIFNVKPHGSMGYEWIIANKEYNLVIGKWKKPQSMPSVVITIRSETLWRKGPHSAIEFILDFIKYVGGKTQKIRVSRLDLCVDALFPDFLWSEHILEHAVTRASYDNTRRNHKQLSTIDIGKNSLKARIYDKPLEIKQRSNKLWFFDIWGFKEVPENHKVIRTEFQLRREVLKELGIDSVDDLFARAQNIWAYCTVDWLKFQDNPGKQSHQRTTLTWWKTIQNGFNNIPAGIPLIRSKACRADKDRLSYQILGLLSSFAALEFQVSSSDITLNRTFEAFQNHIHKNDLDAIEFPERVEDKKAKFQRVDRKHFESINLREELGLLPPIPQPENLHS